MTGPVIAVRIRGLGAREVPGMPCGAPGLAITRAVKNPAVLVITHVRSGLVVAMFAHGDPEAVLACAQALAEVADWTQPASDLAYAVTGARPVIVRWGGSRNIADMATRAELGDIGVQPGGAA
jgi:hypothetical protein